MYIIIDITGFYTLLGNMICQFHVFYLPHVDSTYRLAYRFGERSMNGSPVIGRWLKLWNGQFAPILMMPQCL